MRRHFRLSATVVGAADPQALADFYRLLLGWELKVSEPEWAILVPPDGGAGLSFQREESHVPPTWPAVPGDQQIQMHLDIGVDDLAAGVVQALGLGAVLASYQPQQDVRVLIDPAGHPFCLFVDR